jgi:hypothetical protein
MISSSLGLKAGEYREFVLRLLTREYKDAIVAGFKKYAPYPGALHFVNAPY